MTWNAARALLDAKLVTLSGINTARIAWPGVTFVPPAGAAWYKVSFLPTGTDAALGVGASKHEGGIYQVSVFSPDGSGLGTLLGLADAVVALFDRQLLTNIHTGVPVPAPVLTEPGWLQIPVSIPFVVL